MSGATIGIIICSIIWWKFLGGWNTGVLSIQGLICVILGSILGTIGEAILRLQSGAEIEDVFPISLFKSLIAGKRSKNEMILKELKSDASKLLDKISTCQDCEKKKIQLYKAVHSYCPFPSYPEVYTRLEEISVWFDHEKLSKENFNVLHDIFYRQTKKAAKDIITIQSIMLLAISTIGVLIIRMNPLPESARLGPSAILLGIILLIIPPFSWFGVFFKIREGHWGMKLYITAMGEDMYRSDFGEWKNNSLALSVVNFVLLLISAIILVYKVW